MVDSQIGLDFTVRVPAIRTPAPTSPGSSSSQAGARNVARRRDGQVARILATLYPHDSPISREQLSRESGIKESSLCGRLADLVPVWIECQRDVCKSNAGVNVNGYRLTAAGRSRVTEATP